MFFEPIEPFLFIHFTSKTKNLFSFFQMLCVTALYAFTIINCNAITLNGNTNVIVFVRITVNKKSVLFFKPNPIIGR